VTLLTPKVHIWREINEEKNVAIAIFLGPAADHALRAGCVYLASRVAGDAVEADHV
jgi:hypothetical protein